jgi:hypothetical protein
VVAEFITIAIGWEEYRNLTLSGEGREGFKREPAAAMRSRDREGTDGEGHSDFLRPVCYATPMTKLLEQALRQVEQLPEGEQDAAAGALLDYVKHMRDMRLTDAQVAEVRRRRADPNRKLLSHEEALERIRRLGS